MYKSFNQLYRAATQSKVRNDYNPNTLQNIQQKIDQWQLDINQLRVTNPQAADAEEAALLKTLADFQVGLDTNRNKTMLKLQQQQQTAPEQAEPASPDMGFADEGFAEPAVQPAA